LCDVFIEFTKCCKVPGAFDRPWRTRGRTVVIGTCGFGSTGSSAVSDYLKEFEDNQVLDNIEFTFPYEPDGLLDLEFHLMEQHARGSASQVSIRRYRNLVKRLGKYIASNTSLSQQALWRLTDDFLESIVQIKWKGYNDVDLGVVQRVFGNSIMRQRVIPALEKAFNRPIETYPLEDIEFSIKPDNFYSECKEYIRRLLTEMGADFRRNIVLDQPFSAEDPEKSFVFFDDPVAIVVDRDPRDVYLFGIKHLMSRGRFMPTDSVEKFVEYYRLLRKNMPYNNGNERILRLNFEDLVYEYEKTTTKIIDFCKLSNNKAKFTIFDPSMSIANTQLFKRFGGYQSDIDYIERHLAEYLYNFDKYPPISHAGKLFHGRSPLNK